MWKEYIHLYIATILVFFIESVQFSRFHFPNFSENQISIFPKYCRLPYFFTFLMVLWGSENCMEPQIINLSKATVRKRIRRQSPPSVIHLHQHRQYMVTTHTKCKLSTLNTQHTHDDVSISLDLSSIHQHVNHMLMY